MDFASLLQQANKNLKHSSKKVNEAQDEVSRERMRQLDQIRLQKLERLRKEELAKQRREDERRAQVIKFVIVFAILLHICFPYIFLSCYPNYMI